MDNFESVERKSYRGLAILSYRVLICMHIIIYLASLILNSPKFKPRTSISQKFQNLLAVLCTVRFVCPIFFKNFLGECPRYLKQYFAQQGLCTLKGSGSIPPEKQMLWGWIWDHFRVKLASYMIMCMHWFMWLSLQKLSFMAHLVFQEIPFWDIEATVVLLY